VWRSAILDRDDQVRQQAMLLARQNTSVAEGVAYLAPGLMHPSPEVRVRTGEAFANLGSVDAVKLLVLAGPNAAKALADADPGVRAHVAFVQQQAYIRDFDVEVAQASFIADPKIGILQSGAVLDVNVHAVIEERIRIVNAWRNALKRLAGSDPGPKTSDWATWLASVQGQQREMPAAPTTPSGKKG